MKKINYEKYENVLYPIVSVLLAIYLLITGIFPELEDFIVRYLKLDGLINMDRIRHAVLFALISLIFIRVVGISNEAKTRSTSVSNALEHVLQKKTKFSTVKIFAYSARNYIDEIKESNVKIDSLQLLLRRADDYSAWFIKDKNAAIAYKRELADVLDKLEHLVSEDGGKDGKPIKKLAIRYYDFEAYSHFAVFDSYSISGLLVPEYDIKKKVRVSDVQILGVGSEYGAVEAIVDSDIDFFNAVWDKSTDDSGLLRKEHSCEMFGVIHQIEQHGQSYVKPTNISILPTPSLLDDFIVKPDHCPISQIHILCVCRYHILNMYNYLRHERALERLNVMVNCIYRAVKHKYNKDIVLFEHGSAGEDSPFNAKSVNHMTIHAILKPNGFDFNKWIQKDNPVTSSLINLDCDENMVVYSNLEELKNDHILRNKDYFLIWDYCDNPDENKIYVYFPQRLETQYLRRVFYSALDISQKEKMFPQYQENGADDYYNWKKYSDHLYQFTDEDISEYRELGACIEEEYKKAGKSG